jgi:hypothetical protein
MQGVPSINQPKETDMQAVMQANEATALDTGTQQARGRLWWLALGALAASQLFAFWLVCSHQVRKAEARQTEATVQQMALSDCLQYIPGSTIASCSNSMEATRASVQQVGDSAKTGAMPVSFSYR